jgi:hypothetical protein
MEEKKPVQFWATEGRSDEHGNSWTQIIIAVNSADEAEAIVGDLRLYTEEETLLALINTE